MKNLVIIAAIGKNGELGANNDLIWKFKEDLQFFRDTTMGHYIVMGQKTYHSLPPTLAGRKYIVISETRIEAKGVETFTTLEAFLAFAHSRTGQKINEIIFVIGGGMIYKQLLPYCDKMILTEIFATADNADVFFPRFNRAEWAVTQGIVQTSPEGVNYRRNIYTRKACT